MGFYDKAGIQIEAIYSEFEALRANGNIINVSSKNKLVEVSNNFLYALCYTHGVNYINEKTEKTILLDGITYAAKY